MRLFSLLAMLLLPLSAHAQMAQRFEQLTTLLEIGDSVLVVDAAATEVWGRVVKVTPSALTVSLIHRKGDTIVTGPEQRRFEAGDVQLVTRATDAGARSGVVFPASWERVDALLPGEDVTITLDSGVKHRSRFDLATSDILRLTTREGRAESFDKQAVARVVRHGYDDRVSDGALIGAAAGIAVGVAALRAAYAACRGCDAPAPGPFYFGVATFTGSIGGFAGWLIDRLHRGKEVVFPAAPSRLKSKPSR